MKNEVEKTLPKSAEKTDLKFVSEKNAFEKRPGKTLLKFCRKNGFKNYGIKKRFPDSEEKRIRKTFLKDRAEMAPDPIRGSSRGQIPVCPGP